MIRLVSTILCVCCVAIVLSEALGLALLWYRGKLTAGTIHDIRLVLAGQKLDESSATEPDAETIPPSNEDVLKERTDRTFGLSNREEQLEALRAMIDGHRKSLLEDQRKFEESKKNFQSRLEQYKADITNESVSRAQAILLAMPETDAVDHLMELDLVDAISLFSEMPEKKAAKLLEQFFVEGHPKANERKARGHEILRAISQGQPLKTLVEKTANEALNTDTLPKQN